jgi:hypothetical protein
LHSACNLIAAALRVAVLEQLFCFDDLNHFVCNEILDRSSGGHVPPHLSLCVNSQRQQRKGRNTITKQPKNGSKKIAQNSHQRRATRQTAPATASALTIVEERALGCTSTALSNAAMMILWLCLDSSGSLPTQCATSLQECQEARTTADETDGSADAEIERRVAVLGFITCRRGG